MSFGIISSFQCCVKAQDGQQYNLIVESKGFILHFLFHWGSLAQVWDNNSLMFYSEGNLKLVFILTPQTREQRLTQTLLKRNHIHLLPPPPIVGIVVMCFIRINECLQTF